MLSISSTSLANYIIIGLTGAYKWMKDRHARIPIKTGCSTVKVSDESLAGAAQGLLLHGIFSSLRALLGSKVGPP
jgi:hypothetical protein